MKPALHIVSGAQVHDPRPKRREPVSAEAQLRRLFKREAAIMAELAEVRADQHRARQRYAARHDLLMLPGFDTLRRLLR